MELYDWKKARMRSEANISLGVLIIIASLLATWVASASTSLLESPVGLIIVGLVGGAIHVGVTRWRNRGVATVFGLNIIGTVFLVYALIGLMTPDRTKELLQALPDQRGAMIGLGVILIAMGVGLRGMYHRKELEQVAREAESAESSGDNETNG